jgi:alanine racemase
MYGLACGDGGRLRPAMRICARIFDVRSVDGSVPMAYESVKKDHNRRIARVMLGYWDSPLLLTQNNIRVWVKGRLFLPADDVCMDNLCIDVTAAEDIEVGDIAVFLGEEGVTVPEILERNGITYVHSEWLCMTAQRLEKVYINGRHDSND